MAVLCRFNKQIEQLGEMLAAKGIPATCELKGKAGVRLMTMHASKGLEFNSVAIPDLGCMPFQKAGADEEAKLLYVALTRSTDSLFVSYHRESDFTRQCEQLARH